MNRLHDFWKMIKRLRVLFFSTEILSYVPAFLSSVNKCTHVLVVETLLSGFSYVEWAT